MLHFVAATSSVLTVKKKSLGKVSRPNHSFAFFGEANRRESVLAIEQSSRYFSLDAFTRLPV